MANWNPEHYLKYGQQRTRAAADLADRVPLQSPTTIVDLGCGPGNSTHILRSRWPDAEITGVDSSEEMLLQARQSSPDLTWIQADATSWTPDQPVDLVYSNAALQWIPRHAILIRHLLSYVASDGVLAFQIPSSTFAQIRTLIHEVSRFPAWDAVMQAPRSALTMESPSFYYDLLAADTRSLDIWETEYMHVLDSQDAVVDWMAGTGLRPFLAALNSDSERTTFLTELRHRVHDAYEQRTDGRVLFPFRRTFVIACRK